MADDEEPVEGAESTEQLAECGRCGTMIPIDSKECGSCGVKFSGHEVDDRLGECGACGAVVPLDAKFCPNCNAQFVADNVIEILADWMRANEVTVQSLFGKFDTDDSGDIDASELREGLLNLKLADLPPAQIDRLIEHVDADKNGVIDLGELESALGLGDETSDDEDNKDSDDKESTNEQDSDDSDQNDGEDSDKEEKESDDEESEEEGDSKGDSDKEETDSEESDEGETNDEESTDEEEDDLEEVDDEEEDDVDDSEGEDDDADEEEASKELDDEEEKDEHEQEGKEETIQTSNDEDRPTPRQRWLLKNRANLFPILFVIEGIALLIVLANWFIGLIPFGASTEGERLTLIFWRFIGKTLGLVDGDTTSPGGLNLESLILLILILFALGGTIYLRKQVMAWHLRFRRKRPDADNEQSVVSEKTEETDEVETDSSDEEDDDEELDDNEEEIEDQEDDNDDDDNDDDEEDYDDEGEEDGEEEDDGAVDIGSYVGVDDEDGEFFGTIVEFLDDDDEVVVEREDDGEEITVPFDLIFLGDD